MLEALPKASLSATRRQGRNTQTLWCGLSRGAIPLAIARASEKYSGLVLVIADDPALASEIARGVAFYLPADRQAPSSFPQWEALPYERLPPSPTTLAIRIQTLQRLTQSMSGILVVSASALLQRLPPQQWLSAQSFSLATGESLDLKNESRRLEKAGYTRVRQVCERGEYAIRGGLLDIFQIHANAPIRIDLFHDRVESIHTFDPESQRVLGTIEKVDCLPAQEIPLTEPHRKQFSQQWVKKFGGESVNCPVYQDVQRGYMTAGIEHYSPLFFESTCSLFDYLPEKTCVIATEKLPQALDKSMLYNQARYREESSRNNHPLLAPGDLFMETGELFRQMAAFSRVKIVHKVKSKSPYSIDFKSKNPSELLSGQRTKDSVKNILSLVEQAKLQRVLFCTHSPGSRESLLEYLRERQVNAKVFSSFDDFTASGEVFGMRVGDISAGIFLEDTGALVITEEELFNKSIPQRKPSLDGQFSHDRAIRSLAELKTGDLVVHLEHGIGRYQGLKTMTSEESESEFAVLAYAEGAKLYVPVACLYKISRYIGASAESVTLNRLGTDRWRKSRTKAREKIQDMAADLLRLEALRMKRKGVRYRIPEEYSDFCAEFAFEETVDQTKAIEQIQQDMLSDRPMDRLVCGDVGFGKTEVAMRAIFIAAMNNRQVALLAPTTLLARQHYQTLQDRFANWPLHVTLLSRFRSNKELASVHQQLSEGKTDIVVGTHKLLQPAVRFDRLGLVIIDEEHRFGVGQKERLKSLRAETDVLALSATPIPRTLNMALSGLRDLSIMATPPVGRMKVKTFVGEYDSTLIKEAIQRELRRGGQVFYVHNKVATIQKAAAELSQLIPEATLLVAHGQMRQSELERIMVDFYHKRAHILVCSTIVESGIDIPNANTLIIDRADRFGLSSLHQIRGRVGRSFRQAYAYLLTLHPQDIKRDAQKRLKAIQEASDLGVGFHLATHDLEIRGAGNLLGKDQSGEIASVGFSLYMHMLQEAVQTLNAGNQTKPEFGTEEETEIDLHVPALIPEEYIPDVNSRLILYKRIADSGSKKAIRQLRSEMIDRFGMPPRQLDALLKVTEIKLQAKPLGIRRVVVGNKGGELEFRPNTRVSPKTLIDMVQNQPNQYSLRKDHRLCFVADLIDPTERFGYLNSLLQRINPHAGSPP